MTAHRRQIRLSAQLRRRMLEHARSAPDREVCGLVAGSAGQPVNYYPVANVAPDPARRFLMDPEGQIHAMRSMREAGEDLLGIFHSHPDAPAKPSATDRKLAAYPDIVYFIASLKAAAPDLQAYHYNGDRFSKLILADSGKSRRRALRR